MSPENVSFNNMVLHHKHTLLKINAGAKTSKILSKRDREHMRKLGILTLDTTKGKRYILSETTKRVLEI